MKLLLVPLVLAPLVLAGCETPVGVRPADFQEVYGDLRANVLDDGVPSLASRQALAYFGLTERYEAEPAAVITELEALARRERERNFLALIAELSYALALEEEDRTRFFTAALHAYLYLFGEFDTPPNPYSGRFRLMCDLYNRGLAQAMRRPTGEVSLIGGEVETPAGPVVVRSTRPGFPWDEETFSTFLPADAFQVRGLRERVRDPGLGVPLIAVQNQGTELGLGGERLARAIKLPATAFLRLHGGLDEYLDGRLTATLELHLGSDAPTVEVAGIQVPLEADITAPLAYSLEGAGLWKFGKRGFLQGRTEDLPTGIFMLQPFQAGKIPLVLIHGTASSPTTWAQTVNGILADRDLRTRYQVWLALYNTGNPITYSAGLLRESLVELHDQLAAEQNDPVLSNMVLIGHSQGGLVTRLLLSESGDRIWESVSDEPFDATPMKPETRELFETSVFFEPLPFVQRAVFISTPHRGSFVAGGWIGRLASRLVKLPGTLRDAASDMFSAQDLPDELHEIPTSVDNMNPDNSFVQTLAQLPFGEGQHLHSIVAVKPGSRPIEEGDDGVVKYTSAHLDDVESEVVVRYSHSCQGRPETIIELRRILLEHAGDTRP